MLPVIPSSYTFWYACQDLLTKHCTVVAEYLTAHYDEVHLLVNFMILDRYRETNLD